MQNANTDLVIGVVVGCGVVAQGIEQVAHQYSRYSMLIL